MNEPPTDHVRELNERISQWDSEIAHEIQEKREANKGLLDTLALSMRVAICGSIPAVVLIISRFGVDKSSFNQFLVIGTALVGYGIVLAGGARAAALFAHWWFWRSTVNERMATIVTALAFDAVLFGWVLILF
jgi:hypothetical protein